MPGLVGSLGAVYGDRARVEPLSLAAHPLFLPQALAGQVGLAAAGDGVLVLVFQLRELHCGGETLNSGVFHGALPSLLPVIFPVYGLLFDMRQCGVGAERKAGVDVS